jgi:DNA integrity scanning protein DisA with diadenylate cyclase activity
MDKAMDEEGPSTLLDDVCAERPSVDSETLSDIVALAVELAREGREGRKVGTIVTVGDAGAVRDVSQPLILDPLAGHGDDARRVDSPDARETIKELALLDGAFVVTNDGVAVSAARYLAADATGVDLPMGLGTRHRAAAAVTRATDAVAVVVSESAVVRLLDDGALVAEVIPELWILNRYSSHIEAPVLTRSDDQVTVMSRVE